MPGSRTKACAMFTPKGRLVSSRMRRISPRIASSSPDEVSMMPNAPAFDTAAASGERAIQPIGACTIGISTPRRRVTRLSKRMRARQDSGMRRRTSTGRGGARAAALLVRAIGLRLPGRAAAGASAALGEPFALHQGESARIEAEGIELGFDAVLADSRCAQGVQCVWEGDAAVRVWLRVGAGAREEALLHTAAREHRTATLGGYALRLVRLDPAPVAGAAARAPGYPPPPPDPPGPRRAPAPPGPPPRPRGP